MMNQKDEMFKYEQPDAQEAKDTWEKQRSGEGLACQVQCKNSVGQRLIYGTPRRRLVMWCFICF